MPAPGVPGVPGGIPGDIPGVAPGAGGDCMAPGAGMLGDCGGIADRGGGFCTFISACVMALRCAFEVCGRYCWIICI
jgi:hypothetical protein